MSDEEIFQKKLERPLSGLKNIQNNSILYIESYIDDKQVNMEIQIIDASEVSGQFLKRGVPKPPQVEVKSLTQVQGGVMELSDDEACFTVVVGQKRGSPSIHDET